MKRKPRLNTAKYTTRQQHISIYPKKYYEHEPSAATENEDATILWDMPIERERERTIRLLNLGQHINTRTVKIVLLAMVHTLSPVRHLRKFYNKRNKIKCHKILKSI